MSTVFEIISHCKNGINKQSGGLEQNLADSFCGLGATPNLGEGFKQRSIQFISLRHKISIMVTITITR